jgi:hypothetical protein
MKLRPLLYHITRAPAVLRHIRKDNIALVPASLLKSQKAKYQMIANNLPAGGILICETPQKPRITRILCKVASFLREQGHFVKTLPYSMLVS